MAVTGLTAVCYKCSYTGTASNAQACPVCAFPFIHEAGALPDTETGLEAVLNRVSARAGAPRLPGLDTPPPVLRPVAQVPVVQSPEPPRRNESVRLSTKREQRRRSVVALCLVGLTAIAVGVLAAMLGVGL